MRHMIWTTAAIVAGVVFLGGVMYVAYSAQSRSPENLALADRCVAWAHKSPAEQTQDGVAAAAQCDQYFRVRSDHDADEDDERWQKHH